MRSTLEFAAIGLLCILVSTTFMLQTQASDVPPVGYWRFDEDSGTVASDSSGNGNTGSLKNGPQWVDGVEGSALYFDGVDDFVQVPDSPSLTISGNQITVEFWMNPAVTLDGNSDPVNFIDKGMEYVFQFEHDDNGKILYGGEMSFAIAMEPHETNWAVVRTTTNTWIAGTWYHIIGTYDGNYLRLYVNDTLESSTTVSGNLFGLGTNPLGIGSHHLGDWPPEPWGHYFNGYIDEVKVSDHAWSPTEPLPSNSKSSFLSEWWFWTILGLCTTNVVSASLMLRYRRLIKSSNKETSPQKTDSKEIGASSRCSNCGAQLPRTAKFCGMCGKRLE